MKKPFPVSPKPEKADVEKKEKRSRSKNEDEGLDEVGFEKRICDR